MQHKKWTRPVAAATSAPVNARALAAGDVNLVDAVQHAGQQYSKTSKFCLRLAPASKSQGSTPIVAIQPTGAHNAKLATQESLPQHSLPAASAQTVTTSHVKPAAATLATNSNKHRVYVRDARQQARGIQCTEQRPQQYTAVMPHVTAAVAQSNAFTASVRAKKAVAPCASKAAAAPANASVLSQQQPQQLAKRKEQPEQEPQSLQPQHQQYLVRQHQLVRQDAAVMALQRQQEWQHVKSNAEQSQLGTEASQKQTVQQEKLRQLQPHNRQQQYQQQHYQQQHPAEALRRLQQQRQQHKQKGLATRRHQPPLQHTPIVPSLSLQPHRAAAAAKAFAVMQQRTSTAAGSQSTTGQGKVDSNTALLTYKKRRSKLERTAVQAAVPGANFTWVNPACVTHVQLAAAARQQRARQQLRLAQQRQQQQARQRLLASRRARAAVAAGMVGSCKAVASSGSQLAVPPMTAPVAGVRRKRSRVAALPCRKLVRVNGRLYYSTPKGLVSLAAARLIQASSLPALARTAARKRNAAVVQPDPGVKDSMSAKPHVSAATAFAKGRSTWYRETAAAAGGSVGSSMACSSFLNSNFVPKSNLFPVGIAPPAASAARAVKRLASSNAVARSLAVARARQGAQRAAANRGLCLHYCRHGKCDLALQGKCEKVHDPGKVAVCSQWLAGQCTKSDCRLQHKVVPELMPVCLYFMEGVCSNRACPYLHVKVSADAPPCKAFLQGYCPAGAACIKKHLTPKMVKQSQQQPQHSGTPAAGTCKTSGIGAAGRGCHVAGKLDEQEELDGGEAVVINNGQWLQRASSDSYLESLASLLPDAEG